MPLQLPNLRNNEIKLKIITAIPLPLFVVVEY